MKRFFWERWLILTLASLLVLTKDLFMAVTVEKVHVLVLQDIWFPGCRCGGPTKEPALFKTTAVLTKNQDILLKKRPGL